MQAFVGSIMLMVSAFSVVTLTIVGGCSSDHPVSEFEYVDAAKDDLDNGRLNDARVKLRNALGINPKNIEARVLLGKAHLELGNAASAVKELDRAQALGADPASIAIPLAEALLLNRDYEEILSQVNPRVDDPAVSQARLYTIRGEAYSRLGQLDNAADAFRSALSRRKGYAPALIALGRLAMLRGDIEGAEQYADRAAEGSPDDASVWKLYGNLALVRGAYDIAQQSFEKAVQLSPKDLEAKLGLGWSYLYQQKLDDAAVLAKALDAGVQRQPEIQLFLGQLAYLRGDYVQSIDYLRKVTEALPDRHHAALMLAGAYYATDQMEQAQYIVGRILARYPTHRYALVLQGLIQLKRNEPYQAIDTLRQAKSQAPQDADILVLIGSAFLKGGDVEAATESLRDAALAGGGVSKTAERAVAALEEGKLDVATNLLESPMPETDQDYNAEFARLVGMLQNQELDTLIEEANKLRAAHPKDTRLLMLLTAGYLGKGEQEAGVQALEEVMRLDPGNEEAGLNLARMARAKGDLDGASIWLEQVLEYKPYSLKAGAMLAKLDAQQGKNGPAIARLESLLRHHPEVHALRVRLAKLYLDTGTPERVLKIMSDLPPEVARHPSVLGVMGEAQVAMGETAQAIDSFSQLVDAAPGSARPHFLLANAYRLSGQMQEALAQYREVLRVQPGHTQTKKLMVGALVAEKSYPQASKLLDELIAATPDDGSLYLEKGKIALLRGQPKEAVAALEMAFEHAPSSDTLIRLGMARWEVGERETNVALFENWLQQHPNDVAVRFHLANTLLLLKQEDAAREQFSRVVQAQPDNALVLNNLAWLERDVKPESALAHAQRAYDLAPEVVSVVDTLARLLLARGETERAVELLRSANEKAPENRDLKLLLDEALAAEGKP